MGAVQKIGDQCVRVGTAGPSKPELAPAVAVVNIVGF
jgi:hypothetical protein